jgi:aldehyde dehydrogenase (NAD+)
VQRGAPPANANGLALATLEDEIQAELIQHVVQAVKAFYGDDPQKSPGYGRIVNRKATERLAGLLGSGTIAIGGQVDLDDC